MAMELKLSAIYLAVSDACREPTLEELGDDL
jgi:hypothetical protein